MTIKTDLAPYWRKARDVIVRFLSESYPYELDKVHLEHDAVALIARLIEARLLICSPEEMKE